MSSNPESRHVQVDGLNLHYTEAGSGPPVLLLHGWPTSSFLWRNVMPGMAGTNRVIALDLPGFGQSDKPLDRSYNFEFHRKILDGFLDALSIDQLGLVVHDLGGPVGLYWAVHNRERVTRLALLNTLVYPKPSLAVIAFVAAARMPLLRSQLVSPAGLKFAMRIGIYDRENLTDEVVAGVQAPFADRDARKALLKTAYELNPGGFYKIANGLKAFSVPVRIIYGEKDRILPDVARTMNKVKQDLPQAEITVLPDTGHFLQEEQPQKLAEMLGEFFGAGGH